MRSIETLLPFAVIATILVLQILFWRTDPFRELQRFYSAPKRHGFPSIGDCWIDIQRLAIGEKWRPVFGRRGSLLNLPTISVTPAGLQIAWAFNVLFVPWAEIDIHATRTRYEIKGSILLRFQKTRLIAIRISDVVLTKILEFGAPFKFDDQGVLVSMT